MMEFSVGSFRQKGIRFPASFKMRESLDYRKLYLLEQQYSKKGITIRTALKRLRRCTSVDYYYQIVSAQIDAMKYASDVFPPYELLLPDVLMDDWLSIIGPHQEHRRDHSLHQPLTAYIVSELLKGGDDGKGLVLSSGKSLLDECARMFLDMPGTVYLRNYYKELYPHELPPKGYIRETWAKEIFYHSAIVAALFHDIGYPWQYLNKVGGSIELVDKEGVGVQEQSGEDILNYIRKRLLVYPFYGYSDTPQHRPTSQWDREVVNLIKVAYKKTHGFPGALAFMYLNDSIRMFIGDNDINQAECRFIQDWAAVGILMHDMVGQYYGNNHGPDQPRFKLSIDKDPLSCLIAMADVLEEFGRPSAKFTSNMGKVEIQYLHPCKKTVVEVKDNTLDITYLYKTKAEKAKNEDWRKSEVEDYFRVPSGYIDLSEIGIERVTCQVKHLPKSTDVGNEDLGQAQNEERGGWDEIVNLYQAGHDVRDSVSSSE